jgi:RecA-family ATPase
MNDGIEMVRWPPPTDTDGRPKLGRDEEPERKGASPGPLATVSPAAWRGKEPAPQRWLASARVPLGDLTILAGDGGSGKTEIATELLVSVAGGLGDWLGSVLEETGPALFVSCEEPEENIRDRVERICKNREIDPYAIDDLHLHFPELDATWLGVADRAGRISKTPLLIAIEGWIKQYAPRLIVIDSVAAVFDGVAFDRRQVRAFLAMLRKVAREHAVAIVLLDHPSVRGMADGSGTANSVDWRNSVRSMLHLEPSKADPDERTLEVKKSNRGRTGERTKLRWNGLTFTTAAVAGPSPYKAQAERKVDELFLRLLDKRNAQGRPVHSKKAAGSAPSAFASDPDADGVTAQAFRSSMERLFTSNRIVKIESGSPTKRRERIERVSG